MVVELYVAFIKIFKDKMYYFFILSIILSLTACTGKNIYANLSSALYLSDQQELIEAADWDAAKSFEIRIRQNEFRPAIIRLTQGEPYIMLIENRDDEIHMMVAHDFFKTVAIRKILSQTSEISRVNLIGLHLNPGEIKEVHFIPARDGWFDFEGGHGPGIFATDYILSPFSHGSVEGMVGSFIVEE
jgi:hypothetical protein